MSAILTKPKFQKALPPSQRSIAPRRSELDRDVAAFVAQLHGSRNEWAVAVEGITSTSSFYEAFRRAGCEVKVVPQRDEKTGERPTVTKLVNGVEKVYPVVNLWVMLPDGEITNKSGRKPWVSPKVRLENYRKELSDRATSKERREEIEREAQAILERNPQLDGHAEFKRATKAA